MHRKTLFFFLIAQSSLPVLSAPPYNPTKNFSTEATWSAGGRNLDNKNDNFISMALSVQGAIDSFRKTFGVINTFRSALQEKGPLYMLFLRLFEIKNMRPMGLIPPEKFFNSGLLAQQGLNDFIEYLSGRDPSSPGGENFIAKINKEVNEIIKKWRETVLTYQKEWLEANRLSPEEGIKKKEVIESYLYRFENKITNLQNRLLESIKNELLPRITRYTLMIKDFPSIGEDLNIDPQLIKILLPKISMRAEALVKQYFQLRDEEVMANLRDYTKLKEERAKLYTLEPTRGNKEELEKVDGAVTYYTKELTKLNTAKDLYNDYLVNGQAKILPFSLPEQPIKEEIPFATKKVSPIIGNPLKIEGITNFIKGYEKKQNKGSLLTASQKEKAPSYDTGYTPLPPMYAGYFDVEKKEYFPKPVPVVQNTNGFAKVVDLSKIAIPKKTIIN